MRFRHELPPPAPTGGASGLDLVIMRASTDADFRRRLLAEPREAIEATFGIRLPASLRLRFTEKDPDVDVHVILPAPAPACLSDEQLSEVAGGREADWLASIQPL
jgi:hypothetical protein